ncbi:disintegrin and metalloproteinase domain-containing protein 9-like [Anolis sagrei]|uniref:disintegrin and metalloproteinase domain-containing protein 9-like n=1 Tax=Anolis sagrei TaxID=38937 RepID=UPI0035216424
MVEKVPLGRLHCIEGPLGGFFFFFLLLPGFLPSTSTYLYSEVIEPREVESRMMPDDKVIWAFEDEDRDIAMEVASFTDSISYIIKMEEDYKIVHLQRISFIAAHMPVYAYNTKGDLIADYPYIQDDCYYSGSVEGALDSQVVLSTCTGLWGHIQIGAIRYEIKPVANSLTFQHMIYRKRPELRQPCGGGTDAGTNATSEVGNVGTVDGHRPPPPKGRAGKFKDAASARYLEYYLVVDKSTFAAHKHNETQLVLIILHMMADVHAIYLPIGLHVYLVGLELWTENDRVTVSAKSLAITLDAFYKFASNELQRHVHFDHAGILTAKGHPSGLARGDSICRYNHASVSAMRTYLNLQNDAENVAHQLGHSLGFLHDDGSTNLARGCDCNCSKEGSCLMVGKSAP